MKTVKATLAERMKMDRVNKGAVRDLAAIEAEKALLGLLMRDGSLVGTATAILDGPGDFAAHVHQLVYSSIVDLSSKDSPVTVTSVANWLNDRGQIKDVGYDYLADLFNGGYGSVQGDAEMIRDKARLRKASHLLEDLWQEIHYTHEPADAVIEMAEQKIFEIATQRTLKAPKLIQVVLEEASIRYAKRASGQETPGIPFGWPKLDRIITLKPERLTIVAARTSVGKSVFAVNVAANVARAGHSVYMSSLEMPNEETIDRTICYEGRIDSISFEAASIQGREYDQLLDAYDRLKKMRIFLQDAEDQTLLQIISDCRRIKARGRLDLVIIDYLQLIRAEVRRNNRQEEIADISRRLKALARQLKVPVIALAQINRAGAEEEPQLHHLRDSGAIEQDADNVIILHKPEPDDERAWEEVIVRVAKHRGGPKGRVILVHEKPTFRLYESEPGK